MSDKPAEKESLRSKLTVAIILAIAGGAVTLVFTYHVQIWQFIFPPKPRTPVVAAEVLEAIVRDLENTEGDQRPGRRYLSLTHLHNDPSLKQDALNKARAAIKAAIGALAPSGQVPALTPIGPEKTVLAFHLDDIGWEAKKQWRALLGQYPYALDLSGVGDQRLAKADRKMRELAGALPCVRGDWFASAIGRPPLGGTDGALKNKRELPEDVRAFALAYDEQVLDLATAARELGADPEKVADKVRQDKRLKEKLGLAPLADGKTITRAVWESKRFTTSPYQELAQELDLGTPESR